MQPQVALCLHLVAINFSNALKLERQEVDCMHQGSVKYIRKNTHINLYFNSYGCPTNSIE